MQNRQQSQQTEPFTDFRSALEWGLLVLRVGAVILEVFFRKGFGARYFGVQAALAGALILFWSLGWEGYDHAPLWYFFLAYLGMLLVARIGTQRRWMRGEVAHSHYSGTPRLLALLPHVDEVTVKRGLEPLIGFLAGVLIYAVDHPLGSLITFSAMCLYFYVGISEITQQARARNLNDAILEQEDLIGRFREMRGGRVG